MGKLSSHVRSNVVGYAALFVALSGTAWAATELDKNEVKSKHIGKGQVKTSDLGENSVTSPKVADGSLLDDDFAPGQLPAGERGPEGPPGDPGPPGSPDTPQQVLDKVKGVDGSGSGLDSDLLDGQSAADFTPASEVHNSGRVAMDDQVPGDPFPTSQTLVDNGTLSVEADCADNAGGSDSALLAVRSDASGWSIATNTDGTADNSANESAAIGIAFAFAFTSGTNLSGGSFTAVAPNGKVLSGDGSAEINDTAAGGADCAFAVTAIGQ